MSYNLIRSTLLAVGFVLMSVGAQFGMAAVVFFDRDDSLITTPTFPNSQAKYNQFTAALTTFGVDTIESATPNAFNPPLTFVGSTITATTQGVAVQAAPGFTIGSQALLEADAFTPQVNTVFSFNSYIKAFGAFITQGGDRTNNNPTTFRLRDTAAAAGVFVDVTQQVGPGWGDNNIFFFGVIDSTPFNEVTILETTDTADAMFYDNIVAGVPEPGSLVLMALGGLVVARRAIRSRRR